MQCDLVRLFEFDAKFILDIKIDQKFQNRSFSKILKHSFVFMHVLMQYKFRFDDSFRSLSVEWGALILAY